MLSFTLIFICLQAISGQIGWQLVMSVGAIALALLCIVSEQVIELGSLGMVRDHLQRFRPQGAATPTGRISHDGDGPRKLGRSLISPTGLLRPDRQA